MEESLESSINHTVPAIGGGRGVRCVFRVVLYSVAFLGISVGGCSGRATARKFWVPPMHRKPHPRFTAHDRGHTLITKNNPRTEKISTLPLP